MGIFIGILYALEIIVAILLIAIILIQPSKSAGGLGATMGGGMTEAVFGPTAGNVLTKGTAVLASVFLIITLILVVVTGHQKKGRSVVESLVEQTAVPGGNVKPALPPTPVTPAVPAAGGPAVAPKAPVESKTAPEPEAPAAPAPTPPPAAAPAPGPAAN